MGESTGTPPDGRPPFRPASPAGRLADHLTGAGRRSGRLRRPPSEGLATQVLQKRGETWVKPLTSQKAIEAPWPYFMGAPVVAALRRFQQRGVPVAPGPLKRRPSAAGEALRLRVIPPGLLVVLADVAAGQAGVRIPIRSRGVAPK